MKEIIAFHSAEGSYYYIGKTDDGYYLRNVHTVIPNEFEKYSMDAIKELFDNLCDRIPECLKVDRVRYDHHENSFMYVVYDDMTEQLYMEQPGVGQNLCAYNCRVAEYNEFFNDVRLLSYNPGTLTLERLRQVCKYKREDLDILREAVYAMGCEDYVDFIIEPRVGGGYSIVKTRYGEPVYECVTIMEDGSIDDAGYYVYTNLLKEKGVRVYKNT